MRTSRVWAGDQMSTECVGTEEEDQQEMVDLWTTPVPLEVSSERCNSTISRFKNGIKKLHDDDLENSLTAYVCLSCGMLLQDYSLCCHLWSCLCFLLFYFCVFNSAFSLIMVWYPLWIRKKIKLTLKKAKDWNTRDRCNCSQLWHIPWSNFRIFLSLSLELIFPVCKTEVVLLPVYILPSKKG